MSENEEWNPSEQQNQSSWQPISALERRVAGVLVEKAKTTPDAYPLSLNALTNGCNQKSNRFPQMNIDADDVEGTIESLRQKGAVGVIQGTGRVAKYRHYMKEWLAVDGTELAVMAELFLRGPQTIGELRGRAARMAPIPDLGTLKPILKTLASRRLVVELAPEGRGQVVTHGLYGPSELDRIRREHGSGGAVSPAPAAPPEIHSSPGSAPAARPPSPTVSREAFPADEITQLRAEVEQLRQEVTRLRQEVEDLWSNVGAK